MKQVGEDKGLTGDLGSSANEAIEQMITRDVDYKPKFVEWAWQTFLEMEEVTDLIKKILAPCDAIVVGASTTAHDQNAECKNAHGALVAQLEQSRTKIKELLKNTMGDSETARKNFNAARADFNAAQASYRILGDIGQTAMFDYCDQLFHIMAQIYGTMGRGFATGHLPKEPGPPQV